MLSLQHLIGRRFVYNPVHERVHFASFRVIRRYIVTDAFIPDHPAYRIFAGRIFQIVDADGMAAQWIDKAHAGDIRGAVADVYDISEWDAQLAFREVVIHRIVIDIQDSFLYAEKELRFIRVIDHLRRPAGFSMLIVIKGTGVNMGEIFRNRCPFYDFPQPGGNDVMFHKDAPFFP